MSNRCARRARYGKIRFVLPSALPARPASVGRKVAAKSGNESPEGTVRSAVDRRKRPSCRPFGAIADVVVAATLASALLAGGGCTGHPKTTAPAKAARAAPVSSAVAQPISDTWDYTVTASPG